MDAYALVAFRLLLPLASIALLGAIKLAAALAQCCR
jgi:hypothetical protein